MIKTDQKAKPDTTWSLPKRKPQGTLEILESGKV
jgi:hypothetical protein